MKKILSVILSICLLISAMTVSAQAAVYYVSTPDYVDAGNYASALGEPAVFSTNSVFQDYNTPNPLNWSLNSLSGNMITSETYKGKLQILILFRTNGQCPNSNGTIERLASESWVEDERVKVIAVGMGESGEDNDTVKQHVEWFKDKYAPGNTSIDFCYSTSSKGWSIIDGYRTVTKESGSITFAVNYVIDPEYNFRYTWQGAYSEANYTAALNLIGIGSEPQPDVPEEYSIRIDGQSAYGEAFRVLDILNQHRAANGLSPLTMDVDLMDVSMQRAAELAVYYSHTRPDNSSWFTLYPHRLQVGDSAENIAIGYWSAEEAMDAWKNSPGHNQNMLTPDFKSVGIGCFVSNDGYMCWVQNFQTGEPLKADTRSDTVAVTRSFKAARENLDITLYGQVDFENLYVGDSAELYARCFNVRFNSCKPQIYLNYVNSTNPGVLSLDITGKGTVILTARAPGEASIFIGLEPLHTGGHYYGLSRDLTVKGQESEPIASGIELDVGENETLASFDCQQGKTYYYNTYYKNKPFSLMETDALTAVIEGNDLTVNVLKPGAIWARYEYHRGGSTMEALTSTSYTFSGIIPEITDSAYVDVYAGYTNAMDPNGGEYLGRVTVDSFGNISTRYCNPTRIESITVKDNGRISFPVPFGLNGVSASFGGDPYNYEIEIYTFYNGEKVTIGRERLSDAPDLSVGDVNSDGEITLDDAVLTLQRAMNVGITGSAFNESAADVNSDGEITLDDAIEILKMAMKVNS